MDSWRKRVIDEAVTWLRTPWHHNAKVKGAGVDCAQFLLGVYSGAGLVKDYDTGPYSKDWMLHNSEEVFLGFIERDMVQVDAPQVGDVIMYRFGRCFSHGAILVEPPARIIHSYLPDGMVIYGDGAMFELSHRKKRFYTLKGRNK